MFSGCESFNQPLDNWDVSNLYSLESMFKWCSNYSYSLKSWNVNYDMDKDSFGLPLEQCPN